MIKFQAETYCDRANIVESLLRKYFFTYYVIVTTGFCNTSSSLCTVSCIFHFTGHNFKIGKTQSKSRKTVLEKSALTSWFLFCFECFKKIQIFRFIIVFGSKVAVFLDRWPESKTAFFLCFLGN